MNEAINTSKFCTDCAFSGTNAARDYTLYKCFAQENFRHYNLVDGHKVYKATYCSEARNTDTFCGAEGKWFKPKPMEVITPVVAPLPPIPSLKIKRGEDLAAALGL